MPQKKLIARYQGHFEPANNYQRYIVLHSRTIDYQEIQCGDDQNFDLHLRPGIFLFRKGLRTNLFPGKIINKDVGRFKDQRCSCLTISVIVFQMASRHLLDMENKGYSGALGSFLMGGNGNFTGFLDASNSVAVNSNESS